MIVDYQIDPMTADAARKEGILDPGPDGDGFVCFISADGPYTGWGKTRLAAFDEAATNYHVKGIDEARRKVAKRETS